MNTKRLLISILVTVVAVALLVHPAMAKMFKVAGRPLNLFGYATQGGAYSLRGDHYDTEEGFNSALFNFFLEGDYTFISNLRFYAAGMFTADWIYPLKRDDASWEDKLFDESRNNLYLDDEYWQLLKEAHLTWTPRDFYVRVGKQIVVWGETDGFRLMDQINPLDTRRGFADVEFETTIIPIWLLRAEYFPPITTGWLQDLGLEFIFNPNADFIPNQTPQLGNDEGGIWAPNILVDLPPPPFGPGGKAHLGSADILDIEEPDHWDAEGHEYGLRVKGVVKDAIITLNGFYGRDNDPVMRALPLVPRMDVAADGLWIIHPNFEGFYPRFRFAGATFSRDITPLRASFLGDVAPVVRLEAFYAWNNTFASVMNTFEESDELRWAIGVDWKVKIPFLNPRTYFSISPQFYHRKIMDYPVDFELANLEEDNYITSLLISTSYFHNKLVPSFFWLHDFNNRADMLRFQVVYDYSHNWHFTLGTLFLMGEEVGKGFEVFENKDFLYFKVSYKWG